MNKGISKLKKAYICAEPDRPKAPTEWRKGMEIYWNSVRSLWRQLENLERSDTSIWKSTGTLSDAFEVNWKTTNISWREHLEVHLYLESTGTLSELFPRAIYVTSFRCGYPDNKNEPTAHASNLTLDKILDFSPYKENKRTPTM